MKIDWTPQNLFIAAAGLIGALVLIPKLGDGLDAVSYLVGAPATAYAAKSTAEEVEDNFDRYLTEQRAYTEALNKIVTQQQAPPIQYQRQPYQPTFDEISPRAEPDAPAGVSIGYTERGEAYCYTMETWWWPTNGRCE